MSDIQQANTAIFREIAHGQKLVILDTVGKHKEVRLNKLYEVFVLRNEDLQDGHELMLRAQNINAFHLTAVCSLLDIEKTFLLERAFKRAGTYYISLTMLLNLLFVERRISAKDQDRFVDLIGQYYMRSMPDFTVMPDDLLKCETFDEFVANLLGGCRYKSQSFYGSHSFPTEIGHIFYKGLVENILDNRSVIEVTSDRSDKEYSYGLHKFLSIRSSQRNPGFVTLVLAYKFNRSDGACDVFSNEDLLTYFKDSIKSQRDYKTGFYSFVKEGIFLTEITDEQGVKLKDVDEYVD